MPCGQAGHQAVLDRKTNMMIRPREGVPCHLLPWQMSGVLPALAARTAEPFHCPRSLREG